MSDIVEFSILPSSSSQVDAPSVVLSAHMEELHLGVLILEDSDSWIVLKPPTDDLKQHEVTQFGDCEVTEPSSEKSAQLLPDDWELAKTTEEPEPEALDRGTLELEAIETELEQHYTLDVVEKQCASPEWNLPDPIPVSIVGPAHHSDTPSHSEQLLGSGDSNASLATTIDVSPPAQSKLRDTRAIYENLEERSRPQAPAPVARATKRQPSDRIFALQARLLGVEAALSAARKK
ncbi:hypothetical protein HKX48_003928 [Thoreauomyces humboldtii]|nr:hypothetical protein HKX48_003928 [Thoreauomyces humboldtii]